MPGNKVDSKQRITVRNLRIREDMAKYLRNLDPNSAYYDPKTRSMRDNPHANQSLGDPDVDYAGEKFVRFSGDTQKHSLAQLFAWEAYEKEVDVHLLAELTKLRCFKGSMRRKRNNSRVKCRRASFSVMEGMNISKLLQSLCCLHRRRTMWSTFAMARLSKEGGTHHNCDRS